MARTALRMRPQPMPRPSPMKAATIQAPVKGWNARDPVADMKEGFAVILDNWFPKTANIALRNGYRQWATGMGTANVDTLAEFAGITARKLIACANLKIYDASANAAATDITAGSAITSNQWQTTNFGKNLFLFNGTDVPRLYDGTTLADTAFTGPTQANLVHVNSYKNRLYIVEKNTMKYWYGGVDSISGALTGVDLATVFRMGGQLQAIVTWPRESYNGPVELLCFVSTLGEILCYAGSYPGAVAATDTWTLVARYYVAPPIGRRCFAILGSDTIVLTTLGAISLTKLGTSGGNLADATIYVTDKINSAFNAAASTQGYGTNFGWDVLPYPAGTYMLINIPVAPGSVAYQFVSNTLTGAWCRFLGMNAQSWSLFNNNIYFGGNDGKVYQADYGTNDNNGSMTSDVLPAYSYFGERQMLKRFLMAKPILESNGSIMLAADMQVDFQNVPSGSTLIVQTGGTPWNTSPWNTSPWTVGSVVSNNTYGISGIGRAGALRLRAMTKNLTLALDAVSIVWEPGGWLG